MRGGVDERPFESSEFDLRDQLFRRQRRLHAVVAVQQIPQRLVDPQRARDIALLGMDAHQVTAGLFVGGIEIDDGRRDLLFGAGGHMLRHQARTEASHQPVMDRLTFRQHPDPK